MSQHLIGLRKVPTKKNASGIWGINEQSKARKDLIWPNPLPETYWYNVALLLHFDGENNTAVFTDVSPSPKTISTSGVITLSTAQSKFGGSSVYFAGNSCLVITAHNDLDFGTGDFTIEMWLYPSSFSNYQFIFGSDVNENSYLMVAFNPLGSNQIGLGKAGIGFPVVFTGSGLQNNVWQHLAICRAGDSNYCFVDGVQYGSMVTDLTNWQTNNPLIGATSGGAAFAGYMDELRITKGVARYTTNFSVQTAAFPDDE